MKKITIILIAVLMVTLISSCGGLENGVLDDSGDTGTIIIRGSAGEETDGSALIKGAVSQAQTDSVLIRAYAVALAPTADCVQAEEEGLFQDIFDETDDTSDCVSNPQGEDLNDFEDLTSSPVLDSNEAFASGEYGCVKVTLCDQIVWEAELDGCEGQNLSDVSGGDNMIEASVATFYWSTEGSEDDGEGTVDGSEGNPFLLANPMVVAAGEATTVTFNLSNNGGNGLDATYDSDADWCNVAAPTLSLQQD